MTLDEISRMPITGQPARKEIFEQLLATYGKPGPDGWSLTEVLRMDRRRRGRILDLLSGVARGMGASAPRYPGRFRIRSLDDQPFDIVKVRPDPDAMPDIVDRDGREHHSPQQWVPMTFTMAADVEMPIADVDNPANSAAWILLQYGHSARDGGSEKRRYGDKRAKLDGKPKAEWIDRWKIVEVAFVDRNPVLFRRPDKHGKQQQAQAAA